MEALLETKIFKVSSDCCLMAVKHYTWWVLHY